MAEHAEYFDYLKKRSALGFIYRRFVSYPRICSRLCGRVLDVGCGIGDFVQHRPNTVGVDINPLTVEFCKSRSLEATLMAPDRIPYDDSTFNGSVLDNVLEHMADPSALLIDIRRVLIPEGRLIVGVPGVKGYSSDPDHKVFYSDDNLAQVVEKAGFRLLDTFYTPMQSTFLSKRLKSYCLYGVFSKT